MEKQEFECLTLCPLDGRYSGIKAVSYTHLDVDKAMVAIKEAGDECYIVGHVEAGDKGVKLC